MPGIQPIENALVITNFIAAVSSPVTARGYRLFADNITYQFDNDIVRPDVSIVSNANKRSEYYLHNVPLFVLDIVSPAALLNDQTEKMEIYRKAGISEYWLVDWQCKQIQIYLFDDDGNGGIKPSLHKTVTESNKYELSIVMLHVMVDFDALFDFGGTGESSTIRPTVIYVKAQDDYTLYLEFDNGEKKLFDVKPYIKGNFYGQLADQEYFQKVRTNGFSVEWPREQDLCPDELYILSESCDGLEK